MRNTSTIAPKSELSSRELANIAAQAASDKLAFDIAAYDVAEHLALSDIFVICSANSSRQVAAVVDAVADALAKAGEKLEFREGHRDDDWVLLNFPDMAIHVQHKDARKYYSLDRLWGDCPKVDLEFDELAQTSVGAS